MKKERCSWCENGHQLYLDYHDQEWGVPVYDSQLLFAKLLLDGAQAGLSWWTILSKRENYRNAFDGFDPEIIAQYDETKIESLLQDKGIVRNKLKVKAFVSNAQAYLQLESSGVDFSEYLWQYVDHQPIVNHWKNETEVPANTPLSDRLSKDLKKAGFKFVGTTIVYAFMQAVGMVNDHITSCHRHQAIIDNYAAQ